MGIYEFKSYLTNCKKATKVENYFLLLSFSILPFSLGSLLIFSFQLSIEGTFFALFFGIIFYFSFRYWFCFYNYLKSDYKIDKLRTDLSIIECQLILHELFTNGNNILISEKDNFLSFRIGKKGEVLNQS